MPIISKPQPSPTPGEGSPAQTPNITTCANCNGSIVPCNCHPACDEPFKGHVHVQTKSHLCGVFTEHATAEKVGTP